MARSSAPPPSWSIAASLTLGHSYPRSPLSDIDTLIMPSPYCTTPLMDDTPALQVTCDVCGLQEEAKAALEQGGWEVDDESRLCCPRCAAPGSRDWLALVAFLVGAGGTLAIRLLEQRPRGVGGMVVAWGVCCWRA